MLGGVKWWWVGPSMVYCCVLLCSHAYTPTIPPPPPPLSLSQAVDVVGQAGKPKTITGFQTHTTPVLLAYGERAELADDECKLLIVSV